MIECCLFSYTGEKERELVAWKRRPSMTKEARASQRATKRIAILRYYFQAMRIARHIEEAHERD